MTFAPGAILLDQLEVFRLRLVDILR